ncbi:MAG: sigma 54-interacting transcriptional regulator [Polyangia bacterium]
MSSESRLISTRIEPGGNLLTIDSAELRVVAGPDKGAALPLGATSVIIGSDADCQLVLHDRTVSSRHAEVRIERNGYVVRDLGSKNGTLLGGFRIERAPLADRMRLRLGKSELVVRALGGTAEIPLARAGEIDRLVAHSVKMRALVAALERLAASDVTVLIEGETGAGKEVAAQALHALGPRASGPFVVFDCGSIAPNLVTAELFGHERGAFSGAAATRAGLFEEADGGTLLVDEIGELPLDVQPALLRVLETKTVRRLGGTRDLRCDVRVVAATNRNLAEEVRAGRFRKDLFFRLAVARVQVPPLRERGDDIPFLARRFASELGAALSPELIAVLYSYDWPGNVRELRNVIARLAAQPDAAPAFGDGRGRLRDPMFDGARLRPLSEARQHAGDDFERRYVELALERAGGNVSRAAELAGASRQMLTRLIAKHGLRVRDRG